MSGRPLNAEEHRILDFLLSEPFEGRDLLRGQVLDTRVAWAERLPVSHPGSRSTSYHADWAIQDLVGYAERVLVTDFGPDSRAEALRIFAGLFDPGGEVEVALRAATSWPNSTSR